MKTSIALLSTALALKASAQVQLLPAGEFKGRDGRPGQGLTWKLSDPQGRALAAQLNQAHGSVRFNIDYEHQSMLSETNGQPAPASGWARMFQWRDGQGLFAIDMQWTARARNMIESGEYAYISPVIKYNKTTGEVTGLVNAALTNIPALDMSPVAQQRMEQLCARAIADDAETGGGLTDSELTVCRALGLNPRDFLAARQTPASSHASASSSYLNDQTLTDQERAACHATGIEPAEFIATRNAQRSADHAEQQESAALHARGADGLSEQEREVCRATGLSEADFLATRDSQQIAR